MHNANHLCQELNILDLIGKLIQDHVKSVFHVPCDSTGIPDVKN